MKRKPFVRLLVVAMAISSCRKSDVGTPEPQPYALPVPANFSAPVFDTQNPMTNEGIELGRKLFYDKRLSGTNQVACASCHLPERSFSDGIALSHLGASGVTLHRNAPALINLAWANNGLFWDGGSTNLESQAFGPITSPDEMAQNLYELIDELKGDPDYVQRFQRAFRQDVNSAGVVKALAQFQRTFISAGSRYDQYIRKETGGALTADELQGLQLVQQKCQGCHKGDLFTDNDYHNNGIDADFSNDQLEGIYQGRYRITYRLADLGKFKTPTLRNVMVTAPYMHDGRFATIEEVLDHYAGKVKVSATTDPLVMPGGSHAPGILLSPDEKQKIIAFLRTLTDNGFLNNPKLQKP